MVKQKIKVDELGRITIPIGIRRMFNIQTKSSIEIEYDNEELVIKSNRIERKFKKEMDDVLDMSLKSYSITKSEYDELKRILNKVLKGCD